MLSPRRNTLTPLELAMLTFVDHHETPRGLIRGDERGNDFGRVRHRPKPKDTLRTIRTYTAGLKQWQEVLPH